MVSAGTTRSPPPTPMNPARIPAAIPRTRPKPTPAIPWIVLTPEAVGVCQSRRAATSTRKMAKARLRPWGEVRVAQRAPSLAVSRLPTASTAATGHTTLPCAA